MGLATGSLEPSLCPSLSMSEALETCGGGLALVPSSDEARR